MKNIKKWDSNEEELKAQNEMIAIGDRSAKLQDESEARQPPIKPMHHPYPFPMITFEI